MNANPAGAHPVRGGLIEHYADVRLFTHQLCEPLETEDFVVQTMVDISPTKWHIAHTSWFFETFLLRDQLKGYKVFHPRFAYLFNSYYNSVGEKHCRPRRGLLSRPTVQEVYEYRAWVDLGMKRLLESCDEKTLREIAPVVALGINHEQQHQELILTDIKNVFAGNPLRPEYAPQAGFTPPPDEPHAMRWIPFSGGIHHTGFEGDGFAFDNESPRHEVLLLDFSLASRPVTCGEFIEFIEAGGYTDPLLWFSDGWAMKEAEKWEAPYYWEKHDGGWHTMTLHGFRAARPHEPVCHISYYEADAFARWAGARLPTEHEWELASHTTPLDGNFADKIVFHPLPAPAFSGGLAQMHGDVWEWTSSPYTAYPGYKPAAGALGEYNGKFMCNQMVLRGGSCATHSTHYRRTYRNFFHPHLRWQFMGLRLAKDGKQ